MSPSIKVPSEHEVLVGYYQRFSNEKSGSVYYRETEDVRTLSKITQEIQSYLLDSSYLATSAIIVTYMNLSTVKHDSLKHTFQIIIAYDGKTSIAIANYVRLDSKGTFAGYSINSCKTISFVSAEFSNELVKTSNVALRGKYIYKLTTTFCATLTGQLCFLLFFYSQID